MIIKPGDLTARLMSSPPHTPNVKKGGKGDDASNVAADVSGKKGGRTSRRRGSQDVDAVDNDGKPSSSVTAENSERVKAAFANRRRSSGDDNVAIDAIQRNAEENEATVSGDSSRKLPPPPPPRGKYGKPPPPPPASGTAREEFITADVMGLVADRRGTLVGNAMAKMQEVGKLSALDSFDEEEENDAKMGVDDDVPQSIKEHDTVALSPMTTATNKTDTSRLTAVEKLKLAAKLGDASGDAEKQHLLHELLESSIYDLEREEQVKLIQSERSLRRNARSSRGRSAGEGSSVGGGGGTKRTKKSHRSHRSHRHKQEDPDRSSTKRDWEMYLNRHDASFSGSVKSTSSTTGNMLAPIPKDVHRVFECVRGSEPLPREKLVSSVVRELMMARRDGGEDGGSVLERDLGSVVVAILSKHDNGGSSSDGGIGKSTLAGLVCVRGDVRSRYTQGVAWLNMRRQPNASLNFEQYSKTLSDICHQIGIQPHHLKLSPFVRTPCEDEAVANVRMRLHMKEARIAMGKLLSSSRFRKKARSSRKTSLLIVLDDVADESDIEWFRFHRRGDGEKVLNDVLVTSRLGQISTATPITVPALSEQEGMNLLLTESDLPSNHPLAKNVSAAKLVKKCLYHPITVKFVGRWLNLKRITSGGMKGFDETLKEINNALKDVDQSTNAVDVLYAVLNGACSPLIKGKASQIIKLCFAAFVTVFCNESSSAAVPVEVATGFFLKVVENLGDVLSKEDPLYQSHGRQSTKLVPEILGALGVFNITKHSTKTLSGEKETSIQIDHELVRCFGEHIVNEDNSMRHLVVNGSKCWNEAYVQSYFAQKASYLWDYLQPDRSRKYALEMIPFHMLQAKMFEDTEVLIRNESFIRGRLWSIGWTEGTRAHVKDAEALWDELQGSPQQQDCASILLKAYEMLETVLMEEVARESGPNGHCTTLEAGRCLHEISLSLAKIGHWHQASRFCSSCVELVSGNVGPSELLAALLYNSSVMNIETNEYDLAREKAEKCLGMRETTSGIESILYVRTLCLLGGIFYKISDYAGAETCFNRSIDILKAQPGRHFLEYGVALYQLGRSLHKRSCYDDALQCYEQALEFEKRELGPSHFFIANIYRHMADALSKRGDIDQAIHTCQLSLDIINESSLASNDAKIRACIVEGSLYSLRGESEKCIGKFKHGLELLHRFSPSKRAKMAQITSVLGAEYEAASKYDAAEQMFEESVNLMEEIFGSQHLDIADVLASLSSVKSMLEKVRAYSSCIILVFTCGLYSYFLLVFVVCA